jgi:hypothetical protein
MVNVYTRASIFHSRATISRGSLSLFVLDIMVLTTRRQARLQEEGEGDKTAEKSIAELDTSRRADQSSSASSSSSSSSSADSDDEPSSEEDTESEYSSEGNQDLEELFAASLKACQAKDEASIQGGDRTAFETNADEVTFGEVEGGIEASKDESDAKRSAADVKGKG